VQVLLNHILPTFEDAASLVDMAPSTYPTLLGTKVSSALAGEKLTITSGSIVATVITPDVPTCAAVVHVIDKVLVPVLDKTEPVPVSPMAVSMAPSVGGYGTDEMGTY
jgi:uncharacterized surface protein with fasciclin (FAS1) repeats